MNKKKKIIISSYDDIKNPYYAGGGAVAIYEIARRLIRKYEVVVITGKYPGGKDEIIEGVEFRRVGTAFLGSKLDQVTFQMGVLWMAMTQEYDLWIESFTPPFSTSFLPLFSRRPVVGLVHMLSGEDMFRKYKIPFFVVERVGLGVYDHLIALSEGMKKRVLRINRRLKVEVIGNGVDLPDLRKINKEKKYVLFIGRIEVNQKGLDLLLKAWSKVCQETDLKLAIAGSGTKSEETKLKAIIDGLGLTSEVILLGRVSGQTKDRIFRDSEAVILPSRFETFPMTALECFSYGLPLICFDIEGLRWIPEENCVKVGAFDEVALAEAIGRVVGDSNLKRRMFKDNRKFAERFSWEEVFRKYDRYLTKLLGRKEEK